MQPGLILDWQYTYWNYTIEVTTQTEAANSLPLALSQSVGTKWKSTRSDKNITTTEPQPFHRTFRWESLSLCETSVARKANGWVKRQTGPVCFQVALADWNGDGILIIFSYVLQGYVPVLPSLCYLPPVMLPMNTEQPELRHESL